MQSQLALFAVALTTIVALDVFWLGLLMRRFYRRRFAPIARMSAGVMAPIWSAAALVYVLLALGIIWFAVPNPPAPVAVAAARGAVLGGVIYGFYNLTNHATLDGWSPDVTIVDTLWGTVLCAAATVAASIADTSIH
jgi:uncharacterized membrane protein